MADFRSDTVTKPSPEMLDAMLKADLGDDVYSDDPTVNTFERELAQMFGKQAALFTPTGSMANQIAIRLLVKPGEELLTETNSHIVRAELGAAATFSGITTRTWLANRGLLDAAQVMEIAAPDAGPYLVSTKAIAIENAHNFGGGSVQDLKQITELQKEASVHGLKLHLDGARIWNAHVASGIALKELASSFDTLSVCFSKGLGAPVGSAIISTSELIAEARIWLKRYGGGMRQIGLLAAAAAYAVENNISRLGEDHKMAREIAIACAQIDNSVINPDEVETNIVALNLAKFNISASELSQELKNEGILTGALGPKFLRLVTHLDISQSDMDKVLTILPPLLKRSLVSK